MLTKLKALGPGLLYAGAAIGVSHILQSTRAGADFGYTLIIAILLAHVFKYPFFAIGPRYALHSGKSLVAGFAQLHRSALLLVLLLTVLTMFTILSAVTMVTSGLAIKLTGLHWSAAQMSVAVLGVCALILVVGRFKVLDNLMKVIMIVLSISTLLAMVFSFNSDVETSKEFMTVFSVNNKEDMGSLIAFLGWMPAPLDLAIWHSIWTTAKMRDHQLNRSGVNFDFNVGFYGTAFLAICFVILGANTLYGTGIGLSAEASAFASQLVDIYTNSLGRWSYPIIIIAAFTTMFSTTLTCFDAIPRVMMEIGKEYKIKTLSNKFVWMAVLAAGTLVILFNFVDNMKQMVTVATVVSFLTAPLLGGLAYLLVKRTSNGDKIWSKRETYLALLGLIFLTVLSIYYLYTL